MQGKPTTEKPTVAVRLLQALEPFVLRGQAALGGHVDEQQRLAGVVAERGVGTLEGVDGDVVESHGSDPTRPRRRRRSAAVGWPRMHATVIRDSQLHWEEHDDPVPGDTELLVAVQAAGLNSADLVQRIGLYPAPPGLAARHPRHGDGGRGRRGRAIGAAVRSRATGSWRWSVAGRRPTLAFVDESHALAVPDALPWPEAGGFPEAFSTAFDALFTQAGLAHGRARAGQRRGRRRGDGRRAAGRGGGRPS